MSLSGFSAYLAGAPNYNFELYRSLVKEITDSFQAISQQVLGHFSDSTPNAQQAPGHQLGIVGEGMLHD